MASIGDLLSPLNIPAAPKKKWSMIKSGVGKDQTHHLTVYLHYQDTAS